MCSGSEAGSYLSLTDFVYHSTLGWRVIKEKKKKLIGEQVMGEPLHAGPLEPHSNVHLPLEIARHPILKGTCNRVALPLEPF